MSVCGGGRGVRLGLDWVFLDFLGVKRVDVAK